MCANSEQEYAQKCAQQMAQAVPIPQTRKTRHNSGEYAENWFKTFARSNVADVTAITYERQIRLYLSSGASATSTYHNAGARGFQPHGRQDKGHEK